MHTHTFSISKHEDGCLLKKIASGVDIKFQLVINFYSLVINLWEMVGWLITEMLIQPELQQ